MLKLLFILLIFHSLGASAIQLNTSIGKHFYRAVTQRSDLQDIVGPNHRFLFANTHWVKGLSHASNSPKNFLLLPETEVARFHAALAERLIKTNSYNQNLQTRGKILSVYKSTPPDFDFTTMVRPNFLDGHCLTMEGETLYPKVLANLYEEGDIGNPSRYVSKWFVPIEQVFFCPTLATYKRNIALFNRWAAYSRFALVVIPKGTKVRMHTGIVAPQFVIDNAEREMLEKNHFIINGLEAAIKYRMEESKTYFENLNLPEDLFQKGLSRFCEFCHGGATQIFVEYAQNYHLFDIEALYNRDGSVFSSSFLRQSMTVEREKKIGSVIKKMPEKVWIPPSEGRKSHFLHDDEAVEIRMHEGLQRLFSNGDFNQEKADIDRILAHFKSQLPGVKGGA